MAGDKVSEFASPMTFRHTSPVDMHNSSRQGGPRVAYKSSTVQYVSPTILMLHGRQHTIVILSFMSYIPSVAYVQGSTTTVASLGNSISRIAFCTLGSFRQAASQFCMSLAST